MPKTKLYCYVDETGQHTCGHGFLVAVVVTGPDREPLRTTLQCIEADCGKGPHKWSKTREKRRLAYIERVIQSRDFRVWFASYKSTRQYRFLTSQTIAKVLSAQQQHSYEATILIDGLDKAGQRSIGKELRRLGIPVKKVRGVSDESEPLIRLADAVAGLVRRALENNPAAQALYYRARAAGVILQIP
jgi:hypothetical protein